MYVCSYDTKWLVTLYRSQITAYACYRVISPCHVLGPVPPQPTNFFFPMAALLQKAYLNWPSCFFTSSSVKVLSALSLWVYASWCSALSMMCQRLGQIHLYLSVKKTWNHTILNWIHVQNWGKQSNYGKIVPEIPYCNKNKRKQLPSDGYQSSYSERFPRWNINILIIPMRSSVNSLNKKILTLFPSVILLYFVVSDL